MSLSVRSGSWALVAKDWRQSTVTGGNCSAARCALTHESGAVANINATASAFILNLHQGIARSRSDWIAAEPRRGPTSADSAKTAFAAIEFQVKARSFGVMTCRCMPRRAAEAPVNAAYQIQRRLMYLKP